jgi:D-proline reductase (dithiol) PrdB
LEEKMENTETTVDGFRYLPPGLAAWIQTFIPEENFKGPIPWTPLEKPLAQSKVALVTSAGISRPPDPPFNMEREKREPYWGDPTSRFLPADTAEADIRVDHLHINTSYILQDIDVILPIRRLHELARDEIVGNAAETHYSFYGFQWERNGFIEQGIAPMAERMKKEEVEAVLLTPA